MNSLRVLYLGAAAPHATSRHRADALRRIGHSVYAYDPYVAIVPASDLLRRLHFRTGYRLLQEKVNGWLASILGDHASIDLIWIDSGELFGRESIRMLREVTQAKVVLYNHDDPTGPRDGERFHSLLTALSMYSLCITVRAETERELRELGASDVLRVWRSYDEVCHTPFRSRDEIPAAFRSQVAFVGTWMRGEGRDDFLIALSSAGIELALWGDRWEKSKYWKHLKKWHRGGSLGGRDYVAAIQGADVCLGLLSAGNRDLHTTRSVEVPYAGGLLCAKRTPEHQELLRENLEAVYWDDANECAERCRELLRDPALRDRILQAGAKRIRSFNVGHEDIAAQVIRRLGAIH